MAGVVNEFPICIVDMICMWAFDTPWAIHMRAWAMNSMKLLLGEL